MLSHSLRDYLTRKNPTLDSNNSLDGPPTKCEEKGFSEITDWRDFNIENLNNCYGDVLDRHWVDPLPDILPGPTGLEREIFDEDSFEHLMTLSIVPPVNESLARALEDLYPDRSGIAINMTRGGRARKSRNPSARTSGTTKFPDWAGAQRATGGYLNLCLGETKLSKKWSSNTPDRHEWFWPLFQITTYCAEVWGTRYGYIVTQDEMVAVRISRQPIESGIALTRSRRQSIPIVAGSFVPRQALSSDEGSTSLSQRETEDRSDVSCASDGLSAMSLDGGEEGSGQLSEQSEEQQSSPPVIHQSSSSPYRDDKNEVEYVLELKSIPWTAHGDGTLTVKLALWWLHMMAAAPGCDISIADGRYFSLDTWIEEGDSYRHSSTGRISRSLPADAHLERPSDSSTLPRCQEEIDISFTNSSPLSSVPENLRTPPGMRLRHWAH